MEGSSIDQFIEHLKTDDALRRRIVEAETAAARDINGATDEITQIAAQEGFDISGWPGRPVNEAPVPTREELDSTACCVLLTCCVEETSMSVTKEA